MKHPKFTFKTEKPTGPYSTFFEKSHYIKLNGKKVGNIDPKDFTIRLMVVKNDINEDGNKNCSWKWIKLAKKCESLQDTKDFLNAHIIQILDKYNLYKLDI